MIRPTTIDSPSVRSPWSPPTAACAPCSWADERPPRPLGRLIDDGHPFLERRAGQLAEYFAGDRNDFDLPLDLRAPSSSAAWPALRTIPYGETVSYGEQARRSATVRKARAVGAANGRNPVGIIVPCHRVIGCRRGAHRLRRRHGDEGLAARPRALGEAALPGI